MTKETNNFKNPSILPEIVKLSKNIEMIKGGMISQISPLISQFETFQNALKPKAMEIFSAFNELNSIIQSQSLPIIKLIHSSIKEIENTFGPLEELSERFEYMLKQLSERNRILIENCIAEGWYPIPEFSASFCPNTDEFEDEMIIAIEQALPEIEKRLCDHYPERKDIISAAFAAHSRGEYMLAIPCLFSQADGICYDAVNIQPFTSKHGARLKDKYSLPSNYAGSTYFKPLFEVEDIRANSATVHPEKLNRHAALHGTSTRCYTKANSLRLISFLGSLDWFLNDHSTP